MGGPRLGAASSAATGCGVDAALPDGLRSEVARPERHVGGADRQHHEQCAQPGAIPYRDNHSVLTMHTIAATIVTGIRITGTCTNKGCAGNPL